MKVINSIKDMRAWSKAQRRQDKIIGFVPTMGFLHEGHLSLIRKAKEHSDLTVISIFVNPAQFAPGEDLDQYPRDFERDEKLCAQEDVNVIFYPSNDNMYLDKHKTYVITEELSKKLCGKSRSTHFRGVTTIVAKLFNIVNPHIAVFGQKDAQQAVIIQRMVTDLNFDIQIIISPIIREADGLAMSSRNKYLNENERKQAAVLYRSLQSAKTEFEKDNRSLLEIKDKITAVIKNEPASRIDYVEIVDAQTLGSPDPGEGDMLIALAVFFGKTRLIDNIIVPGKGEEWSTGVLE
jgi:pantoate--beta-alanine ligase